MRNFKFIMLIALTAIISFAIYSCAKEHENKQSANDVLTETRTNFCTPAQTQGCLLPYWRNNVPVSYAGCPMTVKFRVLKCGLKYSFSDFEILSWGTNSACTTILNQLKSYYLVGNWANYYNLYNQIYRSISKQAEVYELNISGCPPCGTTSVATVDWIETGCKKLCADWSGELPILYEELCGEGCCLRNTKYCSVNGVPTAQGTPTITQLSPCNPIFGNSCNPNTPCNPSCNKL